MRTKPYQFAFHDRVKNTPPTEGTVVNFFERLSNGETLSREEKNNLFHMIQSNSGGSNYKVAGWVFPFGQFMKRYLVKRTYDSKTWTEVWAFDKTCIRSSFYTNDCIDEIIEAPIKELV